MATGSSDRTRKEEEGGRRGEEQMETDDSTGGKEDKGKRRERRKGEKVDGLIEGDLKNKKTHKMTQREATQDGLLPQAETLHLCLFHLH